MPMSTVGYEKVANWGVTSQSEQVFVDSVLEGQPDPPPYFAVMKKINRDGPRLPGERSGPAKLESATLERAIVEGTLAVDVRSAERFASSHIPGTLNIPLGRSLSNWAGWLVPYDRDVVLIADSADLARDATREMSLIGLDRVVGWHDEDVLRAWQQAGRSLETVATSTSAELATELARKGVTVLDVRNDGEWEAGHIDGALHIPLGALQSRIAEVPREGPIVVQCQGGTRSAIAASLLLANGIRDVRNLQGGFRDWSRTPR